MSKENGAASAAMSIIGTFAQTQRIPPGKVLPILAQTFFRVRDGEPPFTDEEMAAALVVANRYQLDPFTKEVYAMRNKGALLIAVGIDGWVALAVRQPTFDGWEWSDEHDDDGTLVSCTCTLHVRGRKVPTRVTEYLRECHRDTGPWRQNPHRMLRHRATAQAVRMTFPMGGLVEPDELESIDDAVPIRAAAAEGRKPGFVRTLKPLLPPQPAAVVNEPFSGDPTKLTPAEEAGLVEQEEPGARG